MLKIVLKEMCNKRKCG